MLESIIDIVRRAGELVRSANDVTAATHEKNGPADLVTEYDLAVQRFLRQELLALLPEADFFGEEGQHDALTSPWTFIVDPIDGTTNLIHDCHQSCVALALWDGEKLVFGCCYNPFREETFVAELGKGAYLNGQPIHVSDMSEMEKALVIVGTSPYEREKTDRVFDMVKRIFQRSADIRRLGSAELDLCWVACGRLDGYVELSLQPWDYAAGRLLVEEAGGRVTAPDGSPLSTCQGGPLLASNGRLHSTLQTILKE